MILLYLGSVVCLSACIAYAIFPSRNRVHMACKMFVAAFAAMILWFCLDGEHGVLMMIYITFKYFVPIGLGAALGVFFALMDQDVLEQQPVLHGSLATA